MAKTLQDLQNEFLQSSNTSNENSLISEFDEKLQNTAKSYDQPLCSQYEYNPDKLTEGFVERPSVSFDLYATEEEIDDVQENSDTYIANKRQKLEDSILLKEQQKTLEKEESDANFFIKTIAAPFKALTSFEGVAQGLVSFDDENFSGNLFERMGQGAVYGWTGEEDADTGERIQSGAALGKALLTGNGDVSDSSWIARMGMSLPVTLFFSIFDPIMVPIKMLGKSKATITGTYHAIHDFVNKKSIGAVEEIADLGKNVVDDTIIKDIVDISHQNGVFNYASASKKTKDILKALDRDEYNIQKILASKEKVDIKEVVKEYKQFDSETKAQSKQVMNNVSVVAAEMSQKVESVFTNIAVNRDYKALEELPFTRKNLNNSIGAKKEDKVVQMDTITRMLSDDKEKLKLINWFKHDLFNSVEDKVHTDMFDILDTLNTSKLSDKKLFAFTKEQIKETIPEFIFNSGLVDLNIIKNAAEEVLIKSPIYSKLTQVKHIDEMVNTFSDTTIKNNLTNFVNNTTFREGLIYKQYDDLEKAINGQIALLSTTKNKNLKNKIKELKKQKLEYEEVIGAIKTRDLINYIKNPKSSDLPVSLRNESEQSVMKIWKHLDARNAEFSNRIFDIQKQIDDELNLQNLLKDRINESINLISNSPSTFDVTDADNALNTLYKQLTLSTQKVQELTRKSNNLIDKLKGVSDDFSVMEDVYDVFKRNPKGFNTSKLSDYVDYKTTDQFDSNPINNKDDILSIKEKTTSKSQFADEYLDKVVDYDTDNIVTMAKKDFADNLKNILKTKKSLNNVSIKNLKDFKKINNDISKNSKKINKLLDTPQMSDDVANSSKIFKIVKNLGIGKVVDNEVLDTNINVLQELNKSVSNILNGVSKKTKISDSQGIFNREFKELVDNHSIRDIQTNVYDFLQNNAEVFLPAMIENPIKTVSSLEHVLNNNILGINSVISDSEELSNISNEIASNIVDSISTFTGLNLSQTSAKKILKEFDIDAETINENTAAFVKRKMTSGSANRVLNNINDGMVDTNLVKSLKILADNNVNTSLVNSAGNIDSEKLQESLSAVINDTLKEHNNVMKELTDFNNNLKFNETPSLTRVLEKTNFNNNLINKLENIVNFDNINNNDFRKISRIKQYQNDSEFINNIIKTNSNVDVDGLLNVYSSALPKSIKDTKHWTGLLQELSKVDPRTITPFFEQTDDLFKSTYSNAFNILARNSQSSPKYRSVLQMISNKNLMVDEIKDLTNLPQNIMLDAKWELLNHFIKVRKGKGLQSNLYTFEWNLAKDKFSKFNNSIVEKMRDDALNLHNLKIDEVSNDKKPIFNLPLLHGFQDVLQVGSSGMTFVDNKLKTLVDDLKFFISDLPRQALLLEVGSDKTLSKELIKINKALVANNMPTMSKKDITDNILNNYIKRVNVVSGQYYGNKNDFISHIPSAALLDTYSNDPGLRKLNNKPQGLFKNTLNAKRYIGRAIDINREVGTSAVSQSADFIVSQFSNTEPEIFAKTLEKLGFKNKDDFQKYLSNNKIASETRINSLLNTLSNEDEKKFFNIFKANNITDHFRNAIADDAINFDDNSFAQFLINLKNNDPNKGAEMFKGIDSLRNVDILSKQFNDIIRYSLNNKILSSSTLNKMNLPKGLNYDVTRELRTIGVDELLADPITKKSLLQLDKDVYSDLFSLDPILSGINANLSTLSLAEDINHMSHAIDNGMFKTLEDINLSNQKYYKRISKSSAFRDIDNYFKIAMRGNKGDGRLSNEERKIIERAVDVFTKDTESVYSLESRLANSKDKSHIYVLKDFYDKTIKPLDIDQEMVTNAYKNFEKAMRAYKGITLMSPGTHVKNFTGNLLALYLSSPSFAESIATNSNGRRIKNAFRYLQQKEQSFLKQYSKTQRANNLAVDPLEGRRLFLKDLEENPNNYEQAKIKISKATNQNNIKPKAFNPLSMINYTPKDVYLEGMDAINLDIIGSAFLDKILNNKSFNINRSIEMMRDIQIGNISFNEAISTMPQLGKVFNKAGITEENFVKKMIRANYNIMGDMTNDFKVGFMNNINQNINYSLNDIFKKDGIDFKIKTPSDLADYRGKLNNEELLTLEGHITDTLENLYNDNNKNRIIRDRLFDQVDLSKFESKYMNHLFLFYGFMKKALENQIRLFNNLDFAGLYGIERFIGHLMINQGIDNGELSSWAKDAQQVPIRMGNKALMLKVDNPFVPAVPNVNLMNEIINSTNPLIKYVVESAASNTNLFLNRDYDSKLQQLYQTFVPASLQKPATITKNIIGLDGESSFADIMDAIAPSVFNVENLDANELYHLEKAFEVLPALLDSMIMDDAKMEAIMSLLPYWGYTPYKFRLTKSNFFS